jgi:hypothetical protein
MEQGPRVPMREVESGLSDIRWEMESICECDKHQAQEKSPKTCNPLETKLRSSFPSGQIDKIPVCIFIAGNRK